MTWLVIIVFTASLVIGFSVLLWSAFRFERQLATARPHILAMLDRQSLRDTEEIHQSLLLKDWQGDRGTVAQILSALTARGLLRCNTLTSNKRDGALTIGYSYELTQLGRQACASLPQLPCAPVSSSPD